MNLLSILLQAAPATEGSSSMFDSMKGFLPFILIFVVFYFFMIRPQQKKQKEIQKAREGMKVGDKVVLSGGIYGTIKEVKENAFIVEVSDGVRIKVDKGSVFNSPENATEQR